MSSRFQCPFVSTVSEFVSPANVGATHETFPSSASPWCTACSVSPTAEAKFADIISLSSTWLSKSPQRSSSSSSLMVAAANEQVAGWNRWWRRCGSTKNFPRLINQKNIDPHRKLWTFITLFIFSITSTCRCNRSSPAIPYSSRPLKLFPTLSRSTFPWREHHSRELLVAATEEALAGGSRERGRTSWASARPWSARHRRASAPLDALECVFELLERLLVPLCCTARTAALSRSCERLTSLTHHRHYLQAGCNRRARARRRPRSRPRNRGRGARPRARSARSGSSVGTGRRMGEPRASRPRRLSRRPVVCRIRRALAACATAAAASRPAAARIARVSGAPCECVKCEGESAEQVKGLRCKRRRAEAWAASRRGRKYHMCERSQKGKPQCGLCVPFRSCAMLRSCNFVGLLRGRPKISYFGSLSKFRTFSLSEAQVPSQFK